MSGAMYRGCSQCGARHHVSEMDAIEWQCQGGCLKVVHDVKREGIAWREMRIAELERAIARLKTERAAMLAELG